MGPPISIDGKVAPLPSRKLPSSLQWGRRLASTESGGSLSEWLRALQASMGPPISIDGKRPLLPPSMLPLLLQWGRRLASTERVSRRDGEVVFA